MSSEKYLSIITITCRDNPRIKEMAAAIQDAVAVSGWDGVEWIVVDEREWSPSEDDRAAFVDEVERATPAGVPFLVRRIAPKLTSLRGPDRRPDLKEDLPAANSARNTGLAIARGDYIVFIDDCQVIASCVLAFAEVCHERGAGMRLGVVTKKNFQPRRGMIGDPLGKQRPLPAKDGQVAGGGFGAPHWAFDKIGGFDEAYDGEHMFEDKDAFVRMSRAGLSWLLHPAAKVFVLPETHTPIQKGRPPKPIRNRGFYRELQEDPNRILPRGPVADFAAIGPAFQDSGIALVAGKEHLAADAGASESSEGSGAVPQVGEDAPTSEHRPPGVPISPAPSEGETEAGPVEPTESAGDAADGEGPPAA